MEFIKPYKVICILAIVTGFAHAGFFELPTPDPWFDSEVDIDPSTLPKEITFNAKAQKLFNETEIPLYIVRVIKEPQDWIGILPENVLPLSKVVSNTSYRFSYKDGEWYKVFSGIQYTGGINIFGAITSHESEIQIGTGVPYSLLGTKGPGRPDDVKPPEPETVIFSGYYGARKVSIEGKVYFKVNESYENIGNSNWFALDKLEINEAQLPPGVEIKQIPNRFNTNQLVKYEIFNSSNTPFYIVKEFDSPMEWLRSLPNNVLPDYKLVSGNSYYSKYIQFSNVKDAWQLNKIYPMLYITPNLIENLLTPEIRLINKIGDCRPEKVDIPEPQPFEIVMFYGTTKYLVRGKIIYTLYEHYNPHAGSPDVRSCEVNKDNMKITDKDWIPIPGGRECNSKLAGYGKRNTAICYDLVNDNWRGPLMVVVPAGGVFQSPFAIGKYEISIGDYSKYCVHTGKCKPVLDKDKFDEPQTDITIRDAEEFTKWLTERTGKTYRLPTSVEWTYAANANGKQPKKDFNCDPIQGDESIKGTGPVSVVSGQANGWGLKNYIGNVQEWVMDGGKVTARGGAYTDPISDCDVSLSRPHSGDADEITSFRVMLEDVP